MEFIAIIPIIFLLIWLQNRIYKKHAFQGLEYDCRLSTDKAFEGDEIELIETISNKKWLPLPWLKAEITASSWLDFAGAQSVVSDQSRFVPSFFMVKSYQKVVRKWKVTCLKRGEFGIQSIVLVSSDLLGFSSMSSPTGITAHITVLPRPIGEEDLGVTPRYTSGDIVVKRHLIDDPFYISGVREYTERDPMNRIHWAATAKEQKIMVYNNDYTSRQSVTVVLNMQSRYYERADVIDKEVMENAIRVCAGIFDNTLSTGMPLRFMANAATVPGSREPTVTQESWGSEYVDSLLQVLAKLQLQCTNDFSEYLSSVYHDITSTDIVIVTAYVNQAIADFARNKAASGTNVRIFLLGSNNNIGYTVVSDCQVFFLDSYFKKEEDAS